jgi:hypothetical protein
MGMNSTTKGIVKFAKYERPSHSQIPPAVVLKRVGIFHKLMISHFL